MRILIKKDCSLKPSLQIKDLDTKEGIVQGYFAAFGNVDAHGDVFSEKAFNRSVEHFKQAKNSRIAHLYMHKEPVGKLKELSVDDKGLFFTSQLSKSTLGRDVLTMYEEGILKEHSVGFYELKSEKDESGANLITEAKLVEGSTVLWGANSETPVTSIKTLDLERATEYLSLVTKLVNTSTISDDTLQALEAQAKELTESLTRLKSTQTEVNILQLFINRLENGHSRNQQPN